MDNIKVIRFTNGEDVICEMNEGGKGFYVLTNPMVFIIHKSTSILMKNWLPADLLEDNEALIHAKEILTVLKPSEQFKTFYMKHIMSIDETENESMTEDEMHDVMDQFSNTGDVLIH